MTTLQDPKYPHKKHRLNRLGKTKREQRQQAILYIALAFVLAALEIRALVWFLG